MTPETIAEITALPEMNDYAAKLIFIRNTGEKAYVDDNIGTATKETLREIIELGTVASMSKEDIGVHLANLERARNYLSALIQGYKIAHAKEVEPKIKAKREKEHRESVLAKAAGLGKLGINMDALSASLSKLVQSKATAPGLVEVKDPKSGAMGWAVAPKPTITLQTCSKCSKSVVSLRIHKC